MPKKNPGPVDLLENACAKIRADLVTINAYAHEVWTDDEIRAFVEYCLQALQSCPADLREVVEACWERTFLTETIGLLLDGGVVYLMQRLDTGEFWPVGEHSQVFGRYELPRGGGVARIAKSSIMHDHPDIDDLVATGVWEERVGVWLFTGAEHPNQDMPPWTSGYARKNPTTSTSVPGAVRKPKKGDYFIKAIDHGGDTLWEVRLKKTIGSTRKGPPWGNGLKAQAFVDALNNGDQDTSNALANERLFGLDEGTRGVVADHLDDVRKNPEDDEDLGYDPRASCSDTEALRELSDGGAGAGSFSDFYDWSEEQALEEGEPRYGRKVVWLISPGTAVEIDPDYVQSTPGNQFDIDKLDAVAQQVEGGGRPHLGVGYGDVRIITKQDIVESRDAWARGETLAGRPFEAKDVGKLLFTVRNGNHRIFGALIGGERKIWMGLTPNMMQEIRDYRKTRKSRYKGRATLLKRLSKMLKEA